MIQHIFIANRGEIACRIISTCKRLGISTSVPYIRDEQNSRFVQMADHGIAFNDSTVQSTYLSIDRIIKMAKEVGADAIHPGYGFLSENPDFAKACETANIVFIGPGHEAIRWMSSKSNAKKGLLSINVPLIPGYQGDDQSIEFIRDQADQIGYPILIKAAMGGGGKGMRRVDSAEFLSDDLSAVKREAMASFGSDDVIIEKYISNARHIEVQILADTSGQVVHLFERECTIQRRYQKVLEESPATIADDSILQKMYQVATSIAKHIGYIGAGTIEFIYDEDSHAFYFLEMNTRLQVEHPVTEAVTGIDIVEWQIRIANGSLLMPQDEIKRSGYAFELRLYAEDPSRQFAPCSGVVKHIKYPVIDGGRIDYFIQDGDLITPHFDPMLAKLIVQGSSRAIAFQKMQFLLDRFVFFGPQTNLLFLQRIISDEQVMNGTYTTSFLDHFLSSDWRVSVQDCDLIATLVIDLVSSASSLIKSLRYYRNNPYQLHQYTYIIDDQEYVIQFEQENDTLDCTIKNVNYVVSDVHVQSDQVSFTVGGRRYMYSFLRENDSIFLHSIVSGNQHVHKKLRFSSSDVSNESGAYNSSLPGTISAVFVEAGQSVKKGERLVSIISMKMEHVTQAHTDGIVQKVCVGEGDTISADQLLLVIDDVNQ